MPSSVSPDGARRYRGMPQWDDVLNEEQADAIHAYLVDLAWDAYDAQQQSAAASQAAN